MDVNEQSTGATAAGEARLSARDGEMALRANATDANGVFGTGCEVRGAIGGAVLVTGELTIGLTNHPDGSVGVTIDHGSEPLQYVQISPDGRVRRRIHRRIGSPR